MTLDLDLALADAAELQARKSPPPAERQLRGRIGLGPDRPMPYIAALRAGDLFVDHTYQRPLERARVRRAAEDWDPTMLGVLDVSDRGEDATPRYAIVNGQHRHAIAVLADPRGDDVPLVCNVHRGLTVVDEAQLMYDLDRGTKALTSWEKWHARVTAGDPYALDVEAVAAAHAMPVTPSMFGATGAAERLVRAGGRDLLQSVVSVLVTPYGPTPAAVKSPMLTGVGRVLTDHGSAVVIERLVQALGRTTPQQLHAAASALREVDGGQLAALVARTIVGHYNRTPGAGGKLGGDR